MTPSIRLFCLLLLLLTASRVGWAAPGSLPRGGEEEVRQLEDMLLPFDEFKRRVDQLALQKPDLPIPLQGRITQLQCWTFTSRQLDAFQTGVEFADQQIALAQAAGDLPGKAGLMICLGRLLQRQGKSGEAQQGFEQALAIAESLGDIRLQARARGYLGEMFAARGNMLEAMRHLQASLDLYKSLGMESWRQLMSIANTYRQLGVYEQAEMLFQELSDTSQARHEVERLHEIRIYQGILYAAKNENGKAIELLAQAEQYFVARQRPVAATEVRLLWVQVLLGLERVEGAFAKLEQVNASIASGEPLEPRLLAMRDVLMGITMEKLGSHQLALYHLNAAINALQKEVHQKLLADAYQAKSRVLKQMGLYQASLQVLEQYIETHHQVEQVFRDRRIMQVQLERELAHQQMKNERLENERKLQQQELQLSRERRQWQVLVMVLLLGALVLYLFKRIRSLNKLSMTDELTGIRNRRQILRQAQTMLQQARYGGNPFSLLVLDVDHFKRVNDSLGHNMGDLVLIAIAQCIGHALREQDMVGRNGGEEFLVLLPHTGIEAAARIAERIRARVAELHIEGVTNVMDIRVSIGAAQYYPEDSSLSALMHRADLAMYQAKQTGRNRVIVAD